MGKAPSRQFVLAGILLLAALAIPCFLGQRHAAAGIDRATILPSLSDAQITITAAGFEPDVLTVTTGIQVVWYNATSTTHILQSGTPVQVFLPLVLKSWAGGSGTARGELEFPVHETKGMVQTGESFSATIPPGGTFAHVFTTPGIHPYYLKTALQFRGQVVVTENQPPTAHITTPQEGAWLAAGEPATFHGQATDPDEGPLTGASLVWISDRDSLLGTGETLSATLTSAGLHTITLTATDSGGLAGTTQVQVRVPAPGISGAVKPLTPVYGPPLDDPVGLALNATETVAYVVEKGAGRLVAVDIDPASPTYRSITPIATGLTDLQMGLALDPGETHAYVVENAPGKLKRVTLATGQVTTVASGLAYPHDLALNAGGSVAYVTLDSGALVSVTLASGQVFTVATGLWHPQSIALLPSGDEAVINEFNDCVVRVDLTTGAVTRFETGAGTFLALALDPAGQKAIATSFGPWPTVKLDVTTGQVERRESLQFRADDLVINAANTQAYVVWRWLGQIAVMDLDSWQTRPLFEALHNPLAVTLNTGQTYAYVLEGESGELSRVALNPAEPDYGRPVCVSSLGRWDGGSGGLALSAGETWALVARDGDPPNLLRVDLSTGLTHTVTTYPLGQLRSVVLSPDELSAYATGHAAVYRVNLADGDVTLLGDPQAYGHSWLNGAALSPDEGSLYVAQHDLNRLLAVDLSSGQVSTVTAELHLPAALALVPGEETAWVLEEGRGDVLTRVDLTTGEQVGTMPLRGWAASYGSGAFASGWAGGLALVADGTAAYLPLTGGGPRYLFRVDLSGSAAVRVRYQPPMRELEDVALNQAETRAYLLDGASSTLFALDMDPASPTSGTLHTLVDGRIHRARQVALSADETTLVVACDAGLAQFRATDGALLAEHSGPFGVNGLALHPTLPLAYATTRDGSLHEVDLTMDEGSVVVAAGLDDPTGVVLNGAATHAYLTERSTGRLLRIDLSTGATTISTDLPPARDLVLDEAGGVAYVLGDRVEDNPRVARVNLASGDVSWACSGAWGGAAFASIVLSQDRQYLYAARRTTGALWRIDLAQAAAVAIPPSSGPHPVTYHPEPVYEEMERQVGGALSPDGHRLYQGDEFTPRLLALDLEANRARLVTGLEWSSLMMAVSPDGQVLYHSRMHTDGLIAVNLTTGAMQQVYAGSVGSLALDPLDTGFAYVTDLPHRQVLHVNLTSGGSIALPVHFQPDFGQMFWPIAVNAAGTHLYLVFTVGEPGDYAVVRFDLATDETTTVTIVDSQGDWPGNIAVDADERYAYVSEQGFAGIFGGTRGGAVRRVDIDPASPTYGQVTLALPDAGEVALLAFDPTGSTLLVGGGYTYLIYEVD